MPRVSNRGKNLLEMSNRGKIYLDVSNPGICDFLEIAVYNIANTVLKLIMYIYIDLPYFKYFFRKI